MTAKRFTLAYETNDQQCIWWAVRDGDITLWKEEVVDLLNEQHETIQRLKQNIDELLSVNIEEELLKENEQLKQRINNRLHYYRELYNHFDKNDGFSYDIVERVVEDLEDILR